MIYADFKEVLRTGNWATPGRIRLWAGALAIGYAAALVYLFATASGLNDFAGRPLGTDFSCLYAAGRLGPAAYDYVRENAQLQTLFGSSASVYGWFYPPFLLAFAQGLSRLPYATALFLWMGATFALYFGSTFWLLRTAGVERPRLWLLLAVAFPAVFVNLTHGQNGFLTAALLMAALAALETRPVLAGVFFGLMIFKPQFAVFLPVALIAGRRWKALAAAALTAAGQALAATAVFGMGIWGAFAASMRLSREIVLEQGAIGFEKIQSAFAFVRHIGGSVDLAYVVQTGVCAWVALTLVGLWRSSADAAVKGAGLALAVLLATPYVLDYDFTMLAPAVILLAAYGMRKGFADYEITCLAILWGCPLVSRQIAGATYFPLGFLAVAIVYIGAIRAARQS